MNTIAQNIKKMREDSKLSQQELAERIIVTRQTVSNWERGISQPDVELLSQVAVALNVELTDLIYDENQPVPELTKPQPASVKTAAILGALWLASLALLLFLLPALPRYRLAFDVYPYWIGYCTINPAFYGLGGALVFALISLWVDFRLQNKLLRVVLLGIGFAISLLYPVLLFGTHWNAFHVWIWEHPALFVVPGVLIFSGFHGKRPRKPAAAKINTNMMEEDAQSPNMASSLEKAGF